MTVLEYLRVARRHWRIILVGLLVGFGLAEVYVQLATPVYSASVQVFVSTPVTDSDLANAFSGGQFDQDRVKSYAEVVKSPAVTAPVLKQLGLPGSAAELGDKISASAPLNTVLLDVSVHDTDRHEVAAIANAVGNQLVQVVQGLESPTAGGQSPVRLTVIKQATQPSVAISPKTHEDLALGLAVGLLLGIAAAALREVLDTSVKTVATAQSVSGAPVLGIIGFDAGSNDRPLIVLADSKAPPAEGYRQLRTNLQFVNVDERPRSLVVTSSVANEGKSTIAANLAVVMAEQGQHVLLVDGDLRKPRVASYMGVEGAVGLTTVLSQRIQPREVIQKFGDGWLSLLPSGQLPPNPSELLGSQEMAKLLTFLESHYDMVIVDAPPLLPVTDAAVLAAIVDGVLLVVRHGRSKRDELARAASVLANVDGNLFGCVLNMTPAKGPESYYYYQSYVNEQAAGQSPSKRFLRNAKAAPVPSAGRSELTTERIENFGESETSHV